MKLLGKHRHQGRFFADESGAALVEFAIVSALFFLAFFQLLGFGIFASNNLMAEKATQLAARIAVTRPAVCTDVPNRITTSGLDPAPRYGTNCRAATDTCAAPATQQCNGSAANVDDTGTTDGEIWARISPMLPPGIEITDLQFTYAFDPNLGYLGGPYTPMVTVDLTVPNDDADLIALFGLISRLAGNAGAEDNFNAPQYRVISISLPAEDLAQSTDG